MSDTDTIDDGHDFLNALADVQRHALGVQKATSRIWTVYCHVEVEVDGQVRSVERPDAEVEAELTDLLARVAILLTTAGGTVGIIAQRARISDEDYVPYSYAIRWEAYAPTVDLRPDRPAPAPAPEIVEQPAPAPPAEEQPAPTPTLESAESLGDVPPPEPELVGAFASSHPDDLREQMDAEIEAGAPA